MNDADTHTYSKGYFGPNIRLEDINALPRDACATSPQLRIIRSPPYTLAHEQEGSLSARGSEEEAASEQE